MKKYKERRLYYFTCAGCGHRANTFKRRRVKAELCRKCRKGPKVDPNQGALFPVEPYTPPAEQVAEMAQLNEDFKNKTKI